jgi:hypothetical protein
VLRTQLPVIAGVEPQNWNDAFARPGPDLTNGRLSMAQGFELVLQACGIAARPGLVAELVRHDRDMLCASSQLYADTIPFLRSLRSGGIRIALVSNCAENTRQLRTGLGASEMLPGRMAAKRSSMAAVTDLVTASLSCGMPEA